MFLLTTKNQLMMNIYHQIDYHMENGAEASGLVEVDLMENLHIIPKKYHTFITTNSLLSNEVVLNDLYNWLKEVRNPIIEGLRHSEQQKEQFIHHFDPSVSHLLTGSFHDGRFLLLEQRGENLYLTLDMDGGFLCEAYIELVFENAKVEGEMEGYYIYDEWKKLDHCYGLRILSSYGSPYAEGTIYFDNVRATNYYRPLVYRDYEIKDINEYLERLGQQNGPYLFLTNGKMVEVTLEQLRLLELEVVRSNTYVTYYEDPYAIFSAPLELSEVVAATFGEDLTLKTRAFNTMYALECEAQDQVNEILSYVNPEENDDIYFRLLASRFEELGCLSEINRKKWIK